MKTKLFITAITILLSFTSFSQNCKYEKNEFDKFTKKMTKITKKVKLIETFNSEGYISLIKKEDSVSVFFNYRASFSKSVKVDDGSELSFLLDNNEIITIKRKNGLYPIELDKLKTLSINKTKTIRYHYTDKDGNYKYSDTEIKSGNADDFMKLIPCVL